MKRTGARLRAIAARLCSAATMERLIDPALADLQAEYEDARRAGRRWQSRWIWALGHAAFFRMIALHGGHCALDLFRGMPGEERRTVIRMSAVRLTIVGLVTGVLAAPPLLRHAAGSHPDPAMLAIYLIPQALPLSIPVGLTFGIFWNLGRIPASRRLRTLVLLIATAISIVSFTILAWVMPASNQALRVSIAGGAVARTATELTLRELGRALDQRTATPATFSPAATRSLALDYHTRWALACAPLVLAIFALVLTARGTRGSLVLGLIATAAIAGYFVILVIARGSALPGPAAAWAPNTALLILSVAASRRRSPDG
jgi:hypothetical protein